MFAAVYENNSLTRGVGLGGAHAGARRGHLRGRTKRRYEPGNPLADGEGYVYYPDINEIEEMTDMMSATRSFETGVEVLNRVKSMQQSLLRLGEV